MKNKIFNILGASAALAAVATVASCSEERALPVGEAEMFISTRVNSDVKVESRATDGLAESTIVWISNSEGVVRKYNGMSAVPPSGIKLLSGEYTVKAWAGKLEYASFESRWFEGEENVTLTAGDKKSVEVVCKIANVVASVKYADNIDEVLSDYTLTVSHKGGSLTFEGRDERKGYYMMPEDVTTLDYVLNGISEGKPIEVRGTIDNVQRAHEYVLNIMATGPEGENPGGAFITIDVDDTMVETEHEVVITTPPAITGFGFDINTPVAGESGSVSRKSVYVCAATPLTSVMVSGVEGEPDFDFVKATDKILNDLSDKGISHNVTDVAEGQMMQIIFDNAYLNTLANRDEPYVITITATDEGRKTATAQLKLRISEAPVITNPVKPETVSYTGVTLEAQVAKDGVESVGFEYRAKGDADWNYIAGTPAARAALAKGQTYTAVLTGLDVNRTYEYRAVSGTAENPTDFRGDIAEITTNNGPQLPNAGMEDWGKDGKTVIPAASTGDQFWDSGNHGSMTMKTNITNNVSSPKHSGSYAAELKSQFVGVGTIGKHAAGNIFVGKYLETAGTDGVIGFGRPFDIPSDIKVKALRLWVKYEPKAANKGANAQYIPKGELDQGHIFVALFDGPDNGDSNANYNGKYGYIVRTGDNARLFDKNASNVCAYGEHIFESATSGAGLIELEIPVEYYAGKGAPKFIAVVCTASRYGDFFSGGEGSLLYVDDFELVYEAK